MKRQSFEVDNHAEKVVKPTDLLGRVDKLLH